MKARAQFVVVSGIPGCGKSTLSMSLAEELGIAYLDKDRILESLFDSLGCPDVATRQRLSRAADLVFERIARTLPRAVLDSFWCHPSSHDSSGTPSHWLLEPAFDVVEIFCHCPPEIAASRFLGRPRHTGHHDSVWTRETLLAQSTSLLSLLPLGLGSVIEIDTSQSIDFQQLVKRLADELKQC